MKKNIVHRLLDGAILIAVLAALTQTASATPPPPAPDASSTACLFGLAGTALVAIRRLVR
jgi:hypothetical protein